MGKQHPRIKVCPRCQMMPEVTDNGRMVQLVQGKVVRYNLVYEIKCVNSRCYPKPTLRSQSYEKVVRFWNHQ